MALTDVKKLAEKALTRNKATTEGVRKEIDGSEAAPDLVPVHVQVLPETKRDWKMEALRRGMSLRDLVEAAVTEYLKKP